MSELKVEKVLVKPTQYTANTLYFLGSVADPNVILEIGFASKTGSHCNWVVNQDAIQSYINSIRNQPNGLAGLDSSGFVMTTNAPVLDRLLIYYGIPISWRNMWDATAVINDIASKYEVWVVGATYQNPTDANYATTQQIITGVKAKGVKVWGYVPTGLNTSGLTQAQMATKVDQWVALGVDGIFLDEFGFDYTNTRQRQIDIVNYVHSKGLPYCANSWVYEDTVCDNISELTWPTNDWRYVNFQTYNPTNLTLPRNTTDCYLLENFCFDNTAVSNMWDTQERAALILTRNATKHMKLWAVATLAEVVGSPGTIDFTKTGGLTRLEDIEMYVGANAYLYDIGTIGIAGYSYGSSGYPVVFDIPKLPARSSAPTAVASIDYTKGVFSRGFGKTSITVTNIANTQKVDVVGDISLVTTPVTGNHTHTAAQIVDMWKPTIKKMTNTQASTVVAAAIIPQLTTPMVANGVYEVEGFLSFLTAATTTGMLAGFNTPTGNVCHLEITVPITNTAVASQLRKIFPNGTETNIGSVLGTGVSSTTSVQTAHIRGIVTCGSTAGDFNLTFATEVAGSAATLQIGSMLKVQRIA